MTVIREHGFALDLPGQWEQVEDEQPGSFVYRDAQEAGTVTVMLLAVRPVYAIADKTRLLSDYVDHRAKYERGQKPSLWQAVPVQEDKGDFLEAWWDATDVAAAMQQRHRVIMVQGVLADVCYEAVGLDAASFDERARAILGGAAVSIPGE